jgi:hypothetical protein
VVVECPHTQRVPEFPSLLVPSVIIAGFALIVLGIRSRMPPTGPR